MTYYNCVSDHYDPDGLCLYESVEDFLRMCDSVFRGRPQLEERGGDYYDGDELVLVCRVLEAAL